MKRIFILLLLALSFVILSPNVSAQTFSGAECDQEGEECCIDPNYLDPNTGQPVGICGAPLVCNIEGLVDIGRCINRTWCGEEGDECCENNAYGNTICNDPNLSCEYVPPPGQPESGDGDYRCIRRTNDEQECGDLNQVCCEIDNESNPEGYELGKCNNIAFTCDEAENRCIFEDPTCGSEGAACCSWFGGNGCNNNSLECSSSTNTCEEYGGTQTKDLLCVDGKSIRTAIGCLQFETVQNILVFFLSWGFGVGGGFAILIIIIAAFQIMTSAGDPIKLQSGQSLLISAVSGIVMLAFSIFILRLIGVNILGLF